VAEFFLEGEDADLLPDAAQGDMEGAEIFGSAEEAIKAGLQEVQFSQEGPEMGQVFVTTLQSQAADEMFGMPKEGRRAEAILSCQGAEGHGCDQGPVDIRVGRMGADGTAFGHKNLQGAIQGWELPQAVEKQALWSS
jgi:hypothetical protein